MLIIMIDEREGMTKSEKMRTLREEERYKYLGELTPSNQRK